MKKKIVSIAATVLLSAVVFDLSVSAESGNMPYIDNQRLAEDLQQ